MTYEFDGKQYKQASAHQTSWGKELVELLPLKGTERVLDIGCGDGRVTQRLAQRVPNGEVLGIDAADGMILAAKEHETINLRFEAIDINEVTFCDEFDVVFSHAALHWVADHTILWRKSHAALKMGGCVRLNFAGKGTCPALIDAISETMGHVSYARYFTGFVWPWYMPTVAAYEKVLSETSFLDVEVREDVRTRIFPSKESLARWIDVPCLVPFLAVIDEGDRQAFRDTVIGLMVQRTRQAEGGYLEHFCRLDVSGRK